jgi:predicted transcriptional regulator
MLADRPDFDDLLKCVFGITAPIAEVFCLLLAEEEATAEKIARRLDCDKSSANRRLATLQEQGLVTRSRNLLDTGGFVYRYEPVSLDRTRERMHETLDEWAVFMHGEIDRVEDPVTPPTCDRPR